jgi:endonuclease IV
MPTVKELRAQCKQKNLHGYSKLKKVELENLLKTEVKEAEVKEAEVKEVKTGGFEMGMHVAKKKNMAASITAAINELNLTAVQIFTHGPRNQRASKMDYKLVKEAAKEIHLYIHSSYPTNPWNGKPEIFAHTMNQFTTAAQVGAIGVVLHIPKILPKEVAETTKAIVDRIKALGINVKVILEMKAVKPGDKSYESPQKIDALIDELKALELEPTNVVICIDTAHIYAGKACIRTYDEGKTYLAALKYPEWIGLIHLNGNEYDSKKRAGDKHAVPFDASDKIWKGLKYSESGCRAFIEWAKEKKIDCILEIKDHHTHGEVQKFIKLAE